MKASNLVLSAMALGATLLAQPAQSKEMSIEACLAEIVSMGASENCNMTGGSTHSVVFCRNGNQRPVLFSITVDDNGYQCNRQNWRDSVFRYD